jgi:hypothetical protein
LFPSKAELDYLTANREFSEDYSYTIKCRLQKKIERFAKEELSLLVEQGYLTEFCKLTENSKVSNDLVAQARRAKEVLDENVENESPRWDLNPRPKVSAPQIAGLRNLRSAG